MAFQIVPMTAGHLDQAEAVEKTCFPEDPWSRQILEEALNGENAAAWAAVEEGVLLGYVFFSRVLDEGSVDNIAVLPAARRRGAASALLNAAHRWGQERGVRIFFLEVRASNGGAAALYQKMGYQEAGRRRNYYLSPREDAIIMKLELMPCT